VIFENAHHRERQDMLQWALEYAGYEVEQTDTLCPWDYNLSLRGIPHAIVEYKCRSRLWDPVYLSKAKADRMITAAKDRGVRPIFIVGEKSYIFTRLNNGYPVVTFKREKDSHVRNDVPELCYAIPLSAFVPV
jgi:hypothetical protein